MAHFWAALFGSQVAGVGDDWAEVASLPPYMPTLLFLRVPDEKVVKNRLHLDVVVDDIPTAQAAAEALGAQQVTEGPLAGPFRWKVMLDPEGNEFCLCLPPQQTAG